MQDLIDNLSSILGFLISFVGIITPIISYFFFIKFETKAIKDKQQEHGEAIQDIKERIEVLVKIGQIEEDNKEIKNRLDKHEEEQKKSLDKLFDLTRQNSQDLAIIVERSKKWEL